ncbi:MAG: hypothetical protein HC923_01615 [Myxococcales bacterium]|nr:hypothetical protein [Myxococcales bacterium]
MSRKASILISRSSAGLLALATVSLPSNTGFSQTCPIGRYCFYAPPSYPTPPGFSVGWDIVFSSPRGTITGTWTSDGSSPTSFSVSPGQPTVVPLSTALGTAASFGTVEKRGLFIDASSPELIVAHRLIAGVWQSSSTIKNSAVALGTRFRMGSYNLNRQSSQDTAYDAASVYAPFGATVTFEAPPSATLPFWEANPDASFTVDLAPGETYVARTIPATECNRELEGGLLTASAPVAVESGGRGWGVSCGVTTNCGDDGADNLIPVRALGTEYVVHDFPSAATDGEDISVVADQVGTEVRINGVVVATLAPGDVHHAQLSGTTYVETSLPAAVFQNSGLTSCEIDMAIIPPIVLGNVGSWATDFNVSGTGVVGVVLRASDVSSLKIDGAVPVFTSSVSVPVDRV